jgi:hypothetical protein
MLHAVRLRKKECPEAHACAAGHRGLVEIYLKSQFNRTPMERGRVTEP